MSGKDLDNLLKGDIDLSDMEEIPHIFTDPTEDLKSVTGKKSLSTKKDKKERAKQWKKRYESL